jgi:hypothetical protein
MMSTRAFALSALAISTICCRPSDSVLTSVRGEQPSPTCSKKRVEFE